MKYGIITFHRAINFGAVLQCCGLCNAMKKLAKESDEVFAVDYSCKAIDSLSKCITMEYGAKAFVKEIIKYPVFAGPHKRQVRNFREFVKKNLSLMPTGKQLDCADVYVTGSDQIWNLDTTHGDSTYFLDTVRSKAKKYSYAASFGNKKQFEKNKDMFMGKLKSFSGISLRESIGLDEISKQTDIQPQVNIDPVFLQNKEEWLKLCSNKIAGEKFILLYTVASPDKLVEQVERFSKKSGLKVYCISDSLKMKKSHPDFTFFNDIGPDVFLELFSKAEYVFTTSFHGTAFSLIFNRPFFVEINNACGKNYRIEQLMKTMQTQSQIADEMSENDMADVIPDWDNVNEQIREQQGLSNEYLKKIINQ